MAYVGKYRIVRRKDSEDLEIARDFVSARGLDLIFGSVVRFRKDYEILPEMYETPEEAYQALISKQVDRDRVGE